MISIRFQWADGKGKLKMAREYQKVMLTLTFSIPSNSLYTQGQ